MIETQAYLVQNIVYHHLKNHPDESIATAAQRFSATEMARNIYDMSLAHAAQDALEDSAQNKSPNPALIFQDRFGKEWESFISAYPPAEKVFAAMSILKTDPQSQENPDARKKLQSEAQRLHERPTSILIAACIAAHLETQSTAQCRRVSETLLGRHGAKNITETLDTAGINGELNNLAQTTLQSLTAWINVPGKQTRPLEKPQQSPAAARPARHPF